MRLLIVFGDEKYIKNKSGRKTNKKTGELNSIMNSDHDITLTFKI